MPFEILFTGENACAVQDCETTPLAAGDVRVRSLTSLISTGTETIVLGRKFAPGTHWDNWVKYPFRPGYAVVGEVAEAGAAVPGLAPGMRVALRKGHGSEHVLPAADCYAVPEGLDTRDAVWFALAKIAFMGVKVAPIGLGSTVLIIGGGPIGQMTVRWCAAAGAARIVLVDMLQERLDLALRGGATTVIGCPVDQATEAIEHACGGLPPVVIDSTGNAAVFEAALGVAACRGTVVVLGDTGHPGGQHLTSDVIIKGLRVIGAHDGHCDAEWTEQRIVELFFSLLARNRVSMEGMNTHVFKPGQAEKAYSVAETRRAETMGILFDWTGTD